MEPSKRYVFSSNTRQFIIRLESIGVIELLSQQNNDHISCGLSHQTCTTHSISKSTLKINKTLLMQGFGDQFAYNNYELFNTMSTNKLFKQKQSSMGNKAKQVISIEYFYPVIPYLSITAVSFSKQSAYFSLKLDANLLYRFALSASHAGLRTGNYCSTRAGFR